MNITQNTKISDIMAEYPWLKQELIRKNAKFRKLDSPMARIMMKRVTILDVSRKFGYEPASIITKLQQMIEARESK